MEHWPNPLPPPEKLESESIDPIKEDPPDPDACWDMPTLIDPNEKQLPHPLEEWLPIEKPKKL